MKRFKNRQDAAERLIERLRSERISFDVVAALPRGGVVLGALVAKAFSVPLELLIPRKIGAPGNAEYAIGAVTEEGEGVWNEDERARVEPGWLKEQVKEQRAEARRRRENYLGNHDRMDLREKHLLIVDDGIATGLTMRAAIQEAKKRGVSKISIAVPVAPTDTLGALQTEGIEMIVLEAPEPFGSIGAFYDTFDQVEDDEVMKLMHV